MKYKEAVGWVTDVFDGEPIATLAKREVIGLLQCGEKNKAIHKEIDNIFEHNHMTYVDRDLWNELKQKYFPEDKIEEMNHQKAIDFIEELWDYDLEMEESWGNFKEMEKRKEEVIKYIRKLAGVKL